MQKKRILIVSYFFAPQNVMGAVRPTKLAKYLTRMGHEVTVICGAGWDVKVDPTLKRDLAELKNVHQLTEWNPVRDVVKRKKEEQPKAAAPVAAPAAPPANPVKRIIRHAMDVAYVYLRWLSDRCFTRLGKRELKKLSGTYDVVFSSYAVHSVHEIAWAARKSGLAKKWIADFRDEVTVPFKCYKGKKERFLRMVREHADVISAVSDGFLDMMDFTQKGRVLSNGYDLEDLPKAAPSEDDGRLRVVYCGQMQDSRRGVGNRDITPMFRALRTLVDEGELKTEELALIYAGREGRLFEAYAKASGLEACVEDRGMLPRDGSLQLQLGANVLLMGSHHMASQRGILTGKLFEYMMMDKPIVCCVTGDLPNSGIKRVLRQTGMGICCEQACADEDEAELLSYLRALVRRWKSGGDLLEGKDVQAVESYNYTELTRTLDSWM